MGAVQPQAAPQAPPQATAPPAQATWTAGGGDDGSTSSNIPLAQVEREIRRGLQTEVEDADIFDLNFAQSASKIIDMKSLCKCPNFGGAPEQWAEWKFRMNNIWMLLGLDGLLKRASRGSELDLDRALQPAEVINKSRCV